MRRPEGRFALALLFAASAAAADQPPSARVGRFVQQVAARYSVEEGLPSADVRRVVLSAEGRVFAETAAGWAAFEAERWQPTSPPTLDSPGIPEPTGARAWAASPT